MPSPGSDVAPTRHLLSISDSRTPPLVVTLPAPASIAPWSVAPGLEATRILTGLWQLADLERDGRVIDLDPTASALQPYLDAGFTTFDMADHYGSAEDVTGRLIARQPALRQRLQVCTKWVPPPGRITREDVRAAVDRALVRLRTDYIDLMQYHAWRFADQSWLDALYYLSELRDTGVVRAIGVTNFDTAHLHVAIASGLPIATNQVSFSLIDQRAAGAMSALCLEHGVRLLAYGTLAGGFLTERWLGAAPPPDDRQTTWSQMKYARFIDAGGGWPRLQSLLATIRGIATRHGVSMANVATRFILDQPAIGGIIIGARLGEREHIADNRRLFSLQLTAEDRRELQLAAQAMHRIPGDCGDEYRRPPFLTASGDLSHHLSSFPPPFPVVESQGRRRVQSGTSWETEFGYARAVRVGSRILVSGTTASHGDRVIGGSSASAQAQFVIDKIEGAIVSLGGTLADVVRTRIYVRNLDDWMSVARVHGQRFGDANPANTLIRADLVGDAYLVEIEAEAELTRPEAV